MTNIGSEEVWDALDRRYGTDRWNIRQTLSVGDDAVRLKVDIGHIAVDAVPEADYRQEHFVTDETREVLYERLEGITETIPWENRE